MTDTPSPAIPQHVAIIMDGNARWAKARSKPIAFGHRQGAETLRNILKPCIEQGIKYLSVYAFSRENWSRPEDEIADLMLLLDMYLRKEMQTLVKNDIQLRVSGDLDMLPKAIRSQISRALDATRHGSSLVFNICLSYGSRQEITEACRQLAQRCERNELKATDINDGMIASHLYTAGIPDPDLLIRTGGEIRLSNFLLWQCAYTELYFTDVLWPDFDGESLKEACKVYAERERRYGKRRAK